MTAPKKQLSADDWIMAGFRALATQGPNALRAEPLARALGTTKGSFYWHFKDVPAYQAQLLHQWEQRAYTDIVASLDPADSAQTRLEQLALLAVSFRDPSYGGGDLEPALRAWARSDARVASAVAHMDARRIAFVGQLCRECGLSDPALPRLIYAAATGLEMLDGASAEENATAMAALLRRVFESPAASKG